MDRGACRATVHGVARSWTCLKQLSTAQDKNFVSLVGSGRFPTSKVVFNGIPKDKHVSKVKPQPCPTSANHKLYYQGSWEDGFL